MTQQQLQTWHVFSGIFLVFWIMLSWFDNFFISLLLCVGGGFAADNLNKFMKVGEFDDEPEIDDLADEVSPADCFVCPDKPLPPEPPTSSNDVSEDEFEADLKDPDFITDEPMTFNASRNIQAEPNGNPPAKELIEESIVFSQKKEDIFEEQKIYEEKRLSPDQFEEVTKEPVEEKEVFEEKRLSPDHSKEVAKEPVEEKEVFEENRSSPLQFKEVIEEKSPTKEVIEDSMLPSENILTEQTILLAPKWFFFLLIF